MEYRRSEDGAGVITQGLFEDMTFEQRPDGGEVVTHTQPRKGFSRGWDERCQVLKGSPACLLEDSREAGVASFARTAGEGWRWSRRKSYGKRGVRRIFAGHCGDLGLSRAEWGGRPSGGCDLLEQKASLDRRCGGWAAGQGEAGWLLRMLVDGQVRANYRTDRWPESMK